MKPNYLFILLHVFSVFEKNIIYLPDQLVMISRRRCKHDANISLTRTVVRRYASIGYFTFIT